MQMRREEPREQTNETSRRKIRVINSTLAKILINSRNEVMSLNLSRHVMAVKRERINMLANLVDRLQRLHQLRPFV